MHMNHNFLNCTLQHRLSSQQHSLMLPMVRVEVRHSQIIVLLPKQLKRWVHTDLQKHQDYLQFEKTDSTD